jgi:signal transduction histidine kinase
MEKILYVDDDVNNLKSFKAQFRREFDVDIAPSAAEAMTLLEQNEYLIVLSDQRMPVKTGVDFFKEIKDIYPKPMRMLVTAYADIAAVIDAVNLGAVFRYLSKPWNGEEMKKALLEAIEVYKLNAESEVDTNYFLYKASHDIRGPLASVMGLVNLAIDDIDKKEEVLNYLEFMQDSLLKLDDTVGEILDVNAIGLRETSKEEIDFEVLLSDIFSGLAYLPDFKTVEFKQSINIQAPIQSDRNILKSILYNLISNAVKFHSANPVVEIDVLSTDEEVVIKVKDNGVGFSAEETNVIFKPFKRLGSEKPGSGLGLYILKIGAEKIGAKISCQRDIGVGAEFVVRFKNKFYLRLNYFG